MISMNTFLDFGPHGGRNGSEHVPDMSSYRATWTYSVSHTIHIIHICALGALGVSAQLIGGLHCAGMAAAFIAHPPPQLARMSRLFSQARPSRPQPVRWRRQSFLMYRVDWWRMLFEEPGFTICGNVVSTNCENLVFTI